MWLILFLWIFLPVYLSGWLVLSLRNGRCTRPKGGGYVYRADDPAIFWTYMWFYGLMDIALTGWAIYLILLAVKIIPCC